MSGHKGRLRKLARRLHAFAAPAIVLALLWAPSVSEACSQCLATRTRENQLAFIWTTVLLSLMPLLVVGGIAYWLRRRLRAVEQERVEAGVEDPRVPALAISRPAPIH